MYYITRYWLLHPVFVELWQFSGHCGKVIFSFIQSISGLCVRIQSKPIYMSQVKSRTRRCRISACPEMSSRTGTYSVTHPFLFSEPLASSDFCGKGSSFIGICSFRTTERLIAESVHPESRRASTWKNRPSLEVRIVFGLSSRFRSRFRRIHSNSIRASWLVWVFQQWLTLFRRNSALASSTFRIRITKERLTFSGGGP